MKFTINGREYEDYQLSNEQIVRLIEGDTLTSNERSLLMERVYQRFKYDLCPRENEGEDNDDVFARFFSGFVNGKCHNKKKVAEKMCCKHRYLQSEMFKVFIEYIKILAENFDNGFYDDRNEYACETSKKIIDYFNEIEYPY